MARGLPVLSALLLALSFPPLHTLVLPFVALVPLVVWLDGLPEGREGAGASTRGGFVFGAVYFGLLFYWIPVALLAPPRLAGSRVGSVVAGSATSVAGGSAVVALLAFGVVVVGLAALATFFLRVLHHATRVRGAPLWVAVPVVWTALEWTRAHLPSTLALPWLGLGTSLTGFPELVGIAEVVGARGVTFWIATVNALLATSVIRFRYGRGRPGRMSSSAPTGARSRPGRTGRMARSGWFARSGWLARSGWRGPLAAAVAVVALPMAWGIWRAATLETREAATVAVLQPNLAGRAKVAADRPPQDGAATLPDGAAALPEGATAVPDGAAALPDGATAVPDGGTALPATGAVAALDALMLGIDSAAVGLVVLPELFLRDAPGEPEAAPLLAALREHSRRVGSPILFGGVGREEAEGAVVPFNSAFLMRPDGLSDFRYDKRRLVPAVERVPFLPRSTTTGLDELGAYGVGQGRPLASVDGVRYGVLVCYESSYPEEARALRLAGADVLVNVTNDAWFGGPRWYARTAALWQHPAHLVMRAVEQRVGVVRSANTGISLLVDPRGRIHERTPLFEADARIARVQTTDIVTLYSRLGDLTGNASALTTLGLILLALRDRRRERRTGG